MKGFMKKGAVIIAAGMLMTGCGDDLKVLTESEEAVIVNYSAGTVAKFNKRQQDGLTVVGQKEEAEEDEDVTSKEESKEEQQTTEDVKEDTTQEDAVQEDTTQAETTQTEQSLSQVLGISGVEIQYTGQYEVNSNYADGKLNLPEAGYTYFAMKFTITNTGTEEAVCDILGKTPIFAVSLNGDSSCKNEVTALPNDLVTYKENIAAGASAETVLVFKVPETDTADITSVRLQVQVNGVGADIAL